MKLNKQHQMLLPESFPEDAYNKFIDASRKLLLSENHNSWKEFAGASNIIAWRYRNCYEYMESYLSSMAKYGDNASFEEIYSREKNIFGMFVSGTSCLDCCCYSIYAIASHPKVFNLKFGPREQRQCSPSKLRKALPVDHRSQDLIEALALIIKSRELRLLWELRNRMAHRSNLPRVIHVSIGSVPTQNKKIHFGSTSSTDEIEGDETLLNSLVNWLSISVENLLKSSEKMLELSSL